MTVRGRFGVDDMAMKRKVRASFGRTVALGGLAFTVSVLVAVAPLAAQQGNLANADAELNRLYQKLESRLMRRPEAKQELVAAQRVWIAFRDAECRFAASGVQGGSIYQQVYQGCLQDLTQARVGNFNNYLNCPEGDVACPVPSN